MDIGSELRVIEVEEIDLDVSLPAMEESDEAASREQISEDV